MIRELRKGAKRLQCYSDFIRDFSLKKFIEVHFNRSKIFLLYFYDAYDVNL